MSTESASTRGDGHLQREKGGDRSLSAGDPSRGSFSREDFSYHLPGELIAQKPLGERGSSRLLTIVGGGLQHLTFADLPRLLKPDDLLVVNDTRVIKARLAAIKDSGGQAEILLERIESERIALCQVRVSKPLQPGRRLSVAAVDLKVLGREGQFYRLEFPDPVLEVLEQHGSVPLPPYIERPASAVDEERYQTVWGSVPGAVAAPTAGLHFDEVLLNRIRAAGVRLATITLHVGAGTFQPLRVSDLREHRMHRERYTIGREVVESVAETVARGGRIVAVGTTVVRALESAATTAGRLEAGPGETALFITPGYRFRLVDALVTNFHLPESTLLMLVCAFGGYQKVLDAYQAAIEEGYRFFSYGDAMFLERAH